LNAIGQGICAFDGEGRLLAWNTLFGKMLNLPSDLLNRGTERLALLSHLSRISAVIEDDLKHSSIAGEHPDTMSPDQKSAQLTVGDQHFELNQSPMNGVGIVTTLTDVTERRKAEELLVHKATVDELTGLPNRTVGLDRLDAAIARTERSGLAVGVLYVDLDGFKQVNDTFGHAIGDELIQDAANRMTECLRRSDTVARIGGDEFLVILPDLKDPGHTNLVAKKLVEALSAPFEIDGNEIHVSCSVGIALGSDASIAPSELMRNADVAMYTAKASGKNTYRYFSPEMNAGLERRLDLEQAFRKALERDELFVAYQPIVDIESRRPVGAEALIRWRRPGSGLVPPDQFIPVIEETNLIVPMGEWVIKRACRDAKRWADAFGEPFLISVNVSPRQFRNARLVEAVIEALDETGMPPQHLRLEVTENILAHNASGIGEIMAELKALGVGISMDDFGTGYSSLAYIRAFPFSTIKIDRSFVSGVTTHEEDAALARTIISMADSLNLSVIAEGVETEDQLGFLANYGCRLVQGYLFGRPEPAETFSGSFKSLLKHAEKLNR